MSEIKNNSTSKVITSNSNPDENSTTTTTLEHHPSLSSSLSSASSSIVHTNELARLPWGAFKEKHCYFLNHLTSLDTNLLSTSTNDLNEKKKPGEYVMQLVMLNFVQLTSKKFDQIINGEKKEKRLKECFQKNDDLQLDQLVQTLGNVAEQCLPSLVRFLIKWHDAQMQNLNHFKQIHQTQQSEQASQLSSLKIPQKAKQQQLIQAKQEREFLDERKELVINSLLCIFLIEILKQLPFHPGNDDILNYIIDLSFKRFLKKDLSPSANFYAQLYADNQFVTDLHAEVIGVLAQSRFILVKRRFSLEFDRLKPNSNNNNLDSLDSNTSSTLTLSSNMTSLNTNLQTGSSSVDQSSSSSSFGLNIQISSTNTHIIKLVMGMKYFRIKMVPIEDFEASFLFLNECAQQFVDTKDKDIKYTLAALFVEILVPITGSVKNEVNIPCLKLFVDVLYSHAFELAAKAKHRMAAFPLLTCLLCVSQKQFFLNNWFQFAQLCMQQFKSKETSLNRIALEAILRLIWVYMIRVKGEKSSETNQRLQAIVQNLFPKGSKLVIPKDMPAGIFIKITQFIAYEKLDFAMKEIVYELLSIDVNATTTTSSSSIILNDLNNSLNNNEMNDLLNNNQNDNINSDSANNNNNNNNDSNLQTGNLQSTPVNNNNNNALNSTTNSTSSSLVSSAFKSSKENLLILPLRMEIGLRSFCLIADTLQQQKETNTNQQPQMPSSSFNHHASTYSDTNTSIYLSQALSQLNLNNRPKSTNLTSNSTNSSTTTTSATSSSIRLMLNDQLAREIGLGTYFEHVRRSFQDIIKTLDATIGRPFLMTRTENASNQPTMDILMDNTSKQTATILTNQNESNINENNMSSSVGGGGAVVTGASLSNNNNEFNIDNGLPNDMFQILGQGIGSVVCQGLNQENTSGMDSDTMMNGSTEQVMNAAKDLTFNAENRQRLCLMRTCVSILPRLMPMFKESELVEMLTRLTIHIDDELKLISFQTLKLLTSDYPTWRRYIFTGFTNFILKEISDMYPKLIEQSLKMLIQLLNAWKLSRSVLNGNIDEHCQIIFHLEGFALFNLCHSHVQRRRYALAILKECRLIGETIKCFRSYPYHAYAVDVLDTAAVHAIKHLHLQCFMQPENNVKPDLAFLIEQSSNWETTANTIFISNTTDQLTTYSSTLNSKQSLNYRQSNMMMSNDDCGNGSGGTGGLLNSIDSPPKEPTVSSSSASASTTSTTTATATTSSLDQSQSMNKQSFINNNNNNNVFTFDPWTECLATFFSYDFIFTKCPQARIDAWPFIYARLQQLLTLVDPNETHEIPRTSILFSSGANSLEKVKRATEREANLNLWKNYLIGACCLTSGSDRYLYYVDYEKALHKSDESTNHETTNITTSTTASSSTSGTTTTSTAVNVDFTVVESTSKFYANFCTATSLLKMIVPFLKCDDTYFRECVIRGLGRINIEAIRDLVEELNSSYIKELLLDQKRNDMKVRRQLKKRDLIRLTIVRIFQLLADQRTLSKRLLDATRTKQVHVKYHFHRQQQLEDEKQLRKTFDDFIESVQLYLEQEQQQLTLPLPTPPPQPQQQQQLIQTAITDFNSQTRLHFSILLHKLINSVHDKEKRTHLLTTSTRTSLFMLCDKWSGRFSLQNNSLINNQYNNNNNNNINTSPQQKVNQGFINSQFNNTSSQQQQQQVRFNQLLYMHQTHYQHHTCYHYYEELELAATKACASLLCCDDTLEQLLSTNNNNNKNNTRLVFAWLTQLLEHANVEMKMFDYCKCTLPNEIYLLAYNVCIQLLEMPMPSSNSTNNTKCLIFEYIIQKCFTSQSQEISDLCFISLAKVYIASALNEKQNNNNNNNNSNKQTGVQTLSNNDKQMNKSFQMHQLLDSNCLSALLALVLINIGSSRLNIHEASIKMLRVINKNHLSDDNNNNNNNISNKIVNDSKTSTLSTNTTASSPGSDSLIETYHIDVINSPVIYSKSKIFIAEFLALRNPENSLSIFCELTSRFENCSNQIRKDILTVLVPWLYNIELIDSNVIKRSLSSQQASSANVSATPNSDKANTSATEIVLNNLFYLTCKFSDQYSLELEMIWAVLGSSFVSNLKIICRYLFIMVSLATYEMLSHVKRICGYLSKTSADLLLDELVNELEIMDSFSNNISRTEKLPFFKYTPTISINNNQTADSTRLSTNREETDSDYSDENDSSSDDDYDDDHDHKLINDHMVNDESSNQDETESESDLEEEENASFGQHLNNNDEYINSDDSDCSSKKKRYKYKVNNNNSKYSNSINQILDNKKSTARLSSINVPFNLLSYVCPLNVLLYHIGHNHQHNHQHNQIPVIYSYHKNHLHHNHYEHVSHLSRSHIALMILTDLFGQDAVATESDYWFLYAPCLFHYCLISFDNSKQLIGEHAKKLFINILTILTLQCGFNSLTDQLNDSCDSIIDSQSIVFDRKFINNSLIEMNKNQRNNNTAACHYNYNFRTNVSNLKFEKSNSTYLPVNAISTQNLHRPLTNMSSAPVSPTHQLTTQQQAPPPTNNNNNNNNNELYQTARHCLNYLIRVLVKAKNQPVWLNELTSSQNYSKKLQSITVINDFVAALQQFLQSICFSKQNNSKQIVSLSRITEKWSQYALKTALATSSPHYASRSLQIFRALQHKFNSTSIMLNVIRRLKDTCTDTNENMQGFVVELLLTLKMNSTLLAAEYINGQQTQTLGNKQQQQKQKSKSLNTKEAKHLNKKQKSATAISKLNVKSTLSNKKLINKSNKLTSIYENSLTLSFFDHKWKVLRERINKSQQQTRCFLMPKFYSYIDQQLAVPTKRHHHNQTLHLLVQTFWSAICLLESDYEHEFVLSIEILMEILSHIDLSTGVVGQLLIHKNEFRTSLEMFTFRINWPNFQGMQNLLLKGCTCSSSANTNEASLRILVKLIPHSFKLNFIDPKNGQKDYGLRGLAMNLIALLPTLIYNYEKPNELCLEAAQAYLKVLKEQCQLLESTAQQRGPINQTNSHHQSYQTSRIEQLKNLTHVMNLYSLGSFGKDRTQWTKCVITYLNEYFQQCQYEDSTTMSSNFYFDWIVFLTELLDKNITNIQFQQCVFTCLISLLNLISFNDPASWSFINEELLRVVVKYMNTMLWTEALDIIRVTVSKSSSLTGINSSSNKTRFFIGNNNNNNLANDQTITNGSSNNTFTSSSSSKKELPGRTLEFDFDVAQFVPKPNFPPLNLLNFHLNRQQHQQQQQVIEQQQQQQNQITFTNSWKRPYLSQAKTRERFLSLLNTLDKNQSVGPTTNAQLNVIVDEKIKQPADILVKFSPASKDSTSKLYFNNNNNHNEIKLSPSHLSSPNKIVSILNTSTSSLSKKSGYDSNGSLNNSATSPKLKFAEQQQNNSPKQTNAPIVSIIQQTASLDVKSMKKSHHRTPSSATIQLGNNNNNNNNSLLIVNGTTNSDAVSLAMEAEFKNRLTSVDDNNFINNTFSFLDDIDSIKNENVYDDNISTNKKFEEFTLNAINPTTDEYDYIQNKPRSKTVSESSNKLDTISISSKSKPIAPKINKVSASIGVASGAEALKAINTMSNNSANNNESKCNYNSANRILLQKIKNQEEQKEMIHISPDKRKSITRIIRSDTFQNNNNNNNNNVGSNTTSNNSQSNLTSNIIYDHRLIDNPTIEASSSNMKTTEQNLKNNSDSLTNILQIKRNELKVSGVSSLSNLLALDDQKSTLKLLDKNDKNYNSSMKSMTLPGHKSSHHSSQSNNSVRLPIYDVNFQDPNKSLSRSNETDKTINYESSMLNFSSFIQILNKKDIENKWSLHMSQNPKSLINTFYLFKCLFKNAKNQLNKLSVDILNYLSKSNKKMYNLNDLEKNIYNINYQINTKLECPCLYFDQESLIRQIKATSDFNAVDEHLKYSLELNEAYKNFDAFKQDLIESLSLVKTLDKQGANEELKHDKRIKLSRAWSKMITQFMILLQSFMKLTLSATNNSINLKLIDRSAEFTQLKRLLCIENDRYKINSNTESLLLNNVNSRQKCISLLLESIEQKEFTKTIILFEFARKTYFSNQIDLDDVVLLACEQASSQNFIAFINTVDDLNKTIEQIIIDNLETTNILNTIDKKSKKIPQNNEEIDC